MKNVKEFIVFGLLFFVLVLLYFIYDSTGYHYGVGCSFCNKNMPYELTPKINSDYPQSFTLLDEDGFEITGVGFRYRQSNFKIKKILCYGYNDTSVLLKCTDSLNNIKYLVSYETGEKSDKGIPAISFKDIDYESYYQIENNYQWIEIDEEKAITIKFMKFLFVVGALLILLHILAKLFSIFRRNIL